MMSGHFIELFAGFDADYSLEIAYHHGEGVRTNYRTDAVDSVLIFVHIGLKSSVDSFLERSETETDRHYAGACLLYTSRCV